jgi:hypothetical protein
MDWLREKHGDDTLHEVGKLFENGINKVFEDGLKTRD